MLSFKVANDYIMKTSAEDIFKRVAIYCAWANLKYHKPQFGHDIIVTLIAAFSGPFDGFNKDQFEDPAISDLLTITDWGWNENWNKDINKWVQKYCKNAEDIKLFNNIAIVLLQGKSDQIYEYLGRNAQDPPPDGVYFPELVAFGFMNGNSWPRI